jgi:hypothetical protein
MNSKPVVLPSRGREIGDSGTHSPCSMMLVPYATSSSNLVLTPLQPPNNPQGDLAIEPQNLGLYALTPTP